MGWYQCWSRAERGYDRARDGIAQAEPTDADEDLRLRPETGRQQFAQLGQLGQGIVPAGPAGRGGDAGDQAAEQDQRRAEMDGGAETPQTKAPEPKEAHHEPPGMFQYPVSQSSALSGMSFRRSGPGQQALPPAP